MFAKLLKHDFRANWKLFGILSLVALSLGLLGGFVLRLLITTLDNAVHQTDPQVMAPVMLMFTLTLVFLGIMAYAIATELMLFYRFYKSKFTDEGYLTFTLPVKTHQLFLSSYLSIILWTLIIGLVVITAFSLIFMLGAAGVSEDSMHFLNPFQAMVDIYGDIYENSPLPTGAVLLQMITTLLYTPCLVMTCIVVGAVVAKKHKILAAIGCYYASGFVSSTITSILTAFSISAVALEYSYEQYVTFYYLQSAASIALGVGCYFLSTWLMKHKLNLP